LGKSTRLINEAEKLQKLAKVFHSRIMNDPIALKKEKDAYLPLPPVRTIDEAVMQANWPAQNHNQSGWKAFNKPKKYL
jgi:hypothetical protein